MRKTIKMFLFVLLVAVMLLTGCELGSYTEIPPVGGDEQGSSPSDKIDNTKNDTSDNGDEEDEAYTVVVYYNNKPFDPEEATVEVIWQNSTESYAVALDKNGEASAGILDGEYDIYLSGLPKQYSYNPNIYSASGDERRVEIELTTISTPVKGDGGVNANPSSMAIYQSGGCYVVKHQGTYRVTCEEGQYLYYEYQPTSPGRYLVESWVSVYDDTINPLMIVYSGTLAYKFSPVQIDDGGAALNGGYTKNFSYEISLENIGPCYTFGIGATSKTGEYPVTIDFAITYLGPVEQNNKTTITVNATAAAKIKIPTALGLENFIPAYTINESEDKVFDHSRYAYDSATGLWRVFDEDAYPKTGGWGPYLCVQIMNVTEAYKITSLYEANFVGLGQNFLTIPVYDSKTGTYTEYDYENFIRSSYAKKCNSDGVCYVTSEMMTFLDIYARSYSLWTDGYSPVEGSPEANGYLSSSNGMWLFACGYYES